MNRPPLPLILLSLLGMAPFSAHALAAPPDTIAAAKLSQDSTQVKIPGAVVTRVFGDLFYIEAEDRASGIRVYMPAHALAAGVRADVEGLIVTDQDAERYIEAWSAGGAGSGDLRPLVLSNRDLGGGAWSFDSVTGAGQRGVAGGRGLNNVGLLIRTQGLVTGFGPGYYVIDDGTISDGEDVAVSTYETIPPPPGSFVDVTGVSSCYVSGEVVHRLVLTNSNEDATLTAGAIAGQVTAGGIVTVGPAVESPHPTPDYYHNVWPLAAPAGTQRVRAHFTQIELDAFDTLLVSDGQGTGYDSYDFFSFSFPIYDRWTPWIPGGEITFTLDTEDSFYLYGRYGFLVDRFELEQSAAPVPGVQATLNPGNRTVTTDDSGLYSFANVAPGTYTVTPSLAGRTFDPAQRAVTVAGTEYHAAVSFVRQ